MYTLGASDDPDYVHCVVPWRVDESQIFFGPCKKRIREHIRRDLLKDRSHRKISTTDEDIVVVGVNASNSQRVRKIVWAGRLNEAMTFAKADQRLKGVRFRDLRQHPWSPLHVGPIMENGELVGYEHVSDEHSGRPKGKPYDSWVYDLIANPNQDRVIVENDGEQDTRIMCLGVSPDQVLDRDCCFLLENIFFASGQGIKFDETALAILRQAQPDESEIDNYAVFGRDALGHVKGLRGTYLEISGPPAERFVKWLKGSLVAQADWVGPDTRRCGKPCGGRTRSEATSRPRARVARRRDCG